MANGNFGGGDGTVNNPYLVEDAYDLDAVRNNLSANYKQVRDINLSSWGNWEPIGQTTGWSDQPGNKPFRGKYDGQYFKIIGLYINNTFEISNLHSIGLFGTVDGAEISGVVLVSPKIFTKTFHRTIVPSSGREDYTSVYVGSLVGSTTSYCSISRCSAHEIEIDLIDNHLPEMSFVWTLVGGLVGYAGFNTTVEKCWCTGEIIGHDLLSLWAGISMSAGGLIGAIISGYVSNCYASMYIDIKDITDEPAPSARRPRRMGGLIGSQYSSNYYNQLYVTNCYATGTVIYRWDAKIEQEDQTGSIFVHGLIGSAHGRDVIDHDKEIIANIVSCYYDTDAYYTLKIVNNPVKFDEDITTEEEKSVFKGYKKDTHLMKQRATFVDWDFETVWGIREHDTYPFLVTAIKAKMKSTPFPLNFRKMRLVE